MSLADTQIVYVKADEKPVREGTLSFTQFSSGDRMKRALTVLAICWFLALASLPILVAHWILTPGFFIAGLVFSVMKYKTGRANENVQVQCPQCDKPVTIKLDPADKLPIYTYCPDCNASLQLTEK